jgi:hypothetical protein
MDDPTPRSKKGRETECVFGALVPKRGPLLFSGSNVPANPSSSPVVVVLKFVAPRVAFQLLSRAGLQSLCGNARMFVGRGPGRAGIFDFSHAINAAK